ADRPVEIIISRILAAAYRHVGSYGAVIRRRTAETLDVVGNLYAYYTYGQGRNRGGDNVVRVITLEEVCVRQGYGRRHGRTVVVECDVEYELRSRPFHRSVKHGVHRPYVEVVKLHDHSV